MALVIVLVIVVVLIDFTVLGFTKSNWRDFIPVISGPDSPISLDYHWIIRFGGNAGVLSQAAT